MVPLRTCADGVCGRAVTVFKAVRASTRRRRGGDIPALHSMLSGKNGVVSPSRHPSGRHNNKLYMYSTIPLSKFGDVAY